MSSNLVEVGYPGGATAEFHEVKEVGAVGSMKKAEGDRNTSSRWHPDETLALLKIRSDMDVAFRESSHKSPLWEVVSRKLAEVGYHRCGHKCKEKFENIYKYHKRTKGQAAKHAGRAYRFSNELEALQHPQPLQFMLFTTSQSQAENVQATIPSSFPPNNRTQDFISTSSAMSSSSGEESEGTIKKKRKLTEFFDNLLKEAIQKQGILQKKFFETLEKHENERIAREDVWRTREMAIIERKQDILMQERLVAATREETLIELLKNFPALSPHKQVNVSSEPVDNTVDIPNWDDDDNTTPVISSRWPKEEIEALIELRTNLDRRYQENVAKGPPWEEISAAMNNLGYDRSAKRCKEKWENINKYFKKVKESNKTRPEGSKTCPYYHQLEALYKQKMDKITSSLNPSHGLKAEDLVRHVMNRPGRPQMYPQHDLLKLDKCLLHEQPELDKSNNGSQNTENDDSADKNEDGEIGHEVIANNCSSVTIVEYVK